MQRRTALIGAGSIAAVVLTGAAAVGANIGILSSADESPIGELGATTEVQSQPPEAVEPTIVDVFIEDPPAIEAPATETKTGVTSSMTEQQFSVDVAGTVTVSATDSVLRLGLVEANPGWTWTSSQSSETEVMVTFTDGTSTFEFYAELADDGTIEARVDQPIVEVVQGPDVVVPAAPSTAGSGGSAPAVQYDDDDDDSGYDDEYEDDVSEDAESEHEYEGGDDDD